MGPEPLHDIFDIVRPFVGTYLGHIFSGATLNDPPQVSTSGPPAATSAAGMPVAAMESSLASEAPLLQTPMVTISVVITSSELSR